MVLYKSMFLLLYIKSWRFAFLFFKWMSAHVVHSTPNITYILCKRSVLNAKTKAWRQFGSKTTNPFGTSQEIYTGKLYTPDEIMIEQPPSVASRKQKLQHFTPQIFGSTAYTDNNNENTFDVEYNVYSMHYLASFHQSRIKNSFVHT